MGWFRDLFGGGIKDAQRQYQDYMQKGMQEMEQRRLEGRGDIQQSLEQALGYGAPYRAVGGEALGALGAGLGLAGGGAQQGALDRFKESPGYQFALQQGLTGVSRGLAARGLAGSGAEARELQRTGQGLASEEYGQYQSRLAGLAGMGQTAAEQAAQQAQQAGSELSRAGEYYGGAEAGLYGQMGQAAAQARMAEAQRTSGLIGGLAGMAFDVAGGLPWGKWFGGGTSGGLGDFSQWPTGRTTYYTRPAGGGY
jgi:hypothetical protein